MNKILRNTLFGAIVPKQSSIRYKFENKTIDELIAIKRDLENQLKLVNQRINKLNETLNQCNCKLLTPIEDDNDIFSTASTFTSL